ncbi:hypothetical protein CRG98_044550 [Punica granatum]|uniref:Uncharacterized protein n=1 Tax=Punica granatum TaxID=22663 RepID=A0A2I0HTM5_PUNGR|nr:hypothetical protein CRG98_044550 [Punica granatum]
MLTWYESAWDVEATTNVGGRRGAPEREDYESLDLNSDCAYDSAMASVVRRSSHDWAFRSEAVLWVGLTLGTKAHLVSMESEDRTWLSHRDGHHFSLVMWTVVYVECAWLMLPPNVLICRRPALLPGQSCFVGALSLGRCVFDLPEANLVTGAVAHCSARCRPCWDGCALLKACFAAGMVVLCWRPTFPWGSCVFNPLEWLCFARGLLSPGAILVSPLKRLLAGKAPVSPLGLLLARRLLVAPLGAVARSPIGVVVHSLGTGVLRCGTRALGAPTYLLDRGSESAVVLALVVPVILTSLLRFVSCPVYLLKTPRLHIAWSLWCALPYFVRVGLSWRSSVIATLEQLGCDWEPHSCTFPDYGLVCAAVLGKARGAESHWDRRVK